MTMMNVKVRTPTKECTASNQRAQLLRFRELITTMLSWQWCLQWLHPMDKFCHGFRSVVTGC